MGPARDTGVSGVTSLRGISDLGSGQRGRILHDPTVLLWGWVYGKDAEQSTQGGGKTSSERVVAFGWFLFCWLDYFHTEIHCFVCWVLFGFVGFFLIKEK